MYMYVYVSSLSLSLSFSSVRLIFSFLANKNQLVKLNKRCNSWADKLGFQKVPFYCWYC